MKGTIRILGLMAAAIAFAGPASASYIAYSNITNFTNFAYVDGGAAADPDNASNTITSLAADDIRGIAGSGGALVTGFTFSVFNGNAAAVSARALVRFYALDAATGLPGTFLGGLNFNPISFDGGTVGLFTYNPGTTIFTIPTSGAFYAGITFDNNGGTTGATASQLNGLGQGIFAPPTIGSSDDLFFQTTTNGSFVTNNPPGSLLFFNSNPTASFGWEFTAAGSPATAVPEPSSLALCGVAGLIALGATRRHARRLPAGGR